MGLYLGLGVLQFLQMIFTQYKQILQITKLAKIITFWGGYLGVNRCENLKGTGREEVSVLKLLLPIFL